MAEGSSSSRQSQCSRRSVVSTVEMQQVIDVGPSIGRILGAAC